MTDELKRVEDPAQSAPLSRLVIEFGPLLAFFAAYGLAGIYWATGVLMVATVAALAASWMMLGRLTPVLVMTALLVVTFGGLTFWLSDPRFIKIKPTIINLLFAFTLFVGLMTKRPLLRLVLGHALQLTDEGWRKLSVRWAFFFVLLAALNEIVWRNFSESTWVNFKTFGIIPLTLAFAMAQVGLIRGHEAKPGSGKN